MVKVSIRMLPEMKARLKDISPAGRMSDVVRRLIQKQIDYVDMKTAEKVAKEKQENSNESSS